MKILIIFLGESFRLGGQYNRNRGSLESHDNQMLACESHNKFINHLLQKSPENKVDTFLATYSTQYYQELKKCYEPFVIGENVYDDVIGYNQLFHNAINNVNVGAYDIILTIRIDIFLKEEFFNNFDLNWNTIRFTFNTWFKGKCGEYPRVGDLIYYIPKKYFSYLNHIVLCHESWEILMNRTNLTCLDLDFMINTYHDSDSEKDFNPLYYIVNRPENNHWHTQGEHFDKNVFIKPDSSSKSRSFKMRF